jgi:hypothetical protein
MKIKKCKYCLREYKYNKKEIIIVYDTFQYDGYVNQGYLHVTPPLFETTNKCIAFECKNCKKLNKTVLERGIAYEVERKNHLNGLFKILEKLGIVKEV